MTGCFARTCIEPDGRRLDICLTEDGMRFDGREGARMLRSKVEWVVGWECFGSGILERVIYDGFLCTDLD
jgi:hypothetical protein